MANERPLNLIWRRKWIVILTFVAFTGAVAVISKSLPRVYSTQSTLLIAQPDRPNTFDSVQAAESVARSYADIIASSNFAARVADQLGGGITRDELSAKVSFESVPETQLLKITAEDRSAKRAKQIADTYANDFIQYAGDNLSETTKSEVSLADAAPLPGSPARPKPTLYTLLGAIVGLGLGLLFAFASSLMDRRVRSADELTELIGEPVLAQIALARGQRARMANEEAYRLLRTNLEFVRPDEPLRSIAIVSASAGEGKSTTALNLARTKREVGDTVLLVEADMRRPGLQPALFPGLEGPLVPGLSSFLSGHADAADVVHETDEPGILLLPAGPLPPSPSALLDSDRGHKLLDRLNDVADVIIVDTPPLTVGADASLVAAHADEVILVVDLRRSTAKGIKGAMAQLELVRKNVAGVLLNRVRGNGQDAYGYSYGYKPIGQQKERWWRRGAKKDKGESPPSLERDGAVAASAEEDQLTARAPD